MARGRNMELDAEYRTWVACGNADTPEARSAFGAGARVMAQDTLNTLNDYATATAGCVCDIRAVDECYDKAHASLHVYYPKVLDDFDTDLGKWCE